ncbi:hypothetical protein C8J56DRAFT_792850, partial [Mycena floridula]
YLLATCTFSPLYGRLCNILGRKRANLTAVLFAGLGTVACGLLIAEHGAARCSEICMSFLYGFYLPLNSWQISGIGADGVFTILS